MRVARRDLPYSCMMRLGTMYCGATLAVAPVVVVCQIPVKGIFGSLFVEGEVERIFVFAVEYAVAGWADAYEVGLEIASAFAARDVVVQVKGAGVAAEGTGVAIASVDGFSGFGRDFFGCVQHGLYHLSKDAT